MCVPELVAKAFEWADGDGSSSVASAVHVRLAESRGLNSSRQPTGSKYPTSQGLSPTNHILKRDLGPESSNSYCTALTSRFGIVMICHGS